MYVLRQGSEHIACHPPPPSLCVRTSKACLYKHRRPTTAQASSKIDIKGPLPSPVRPRPSLLFMPRVLRLVRVSVLLRRFSNIEHDDVIGEGHLELTSTSTSICLSLSHVIMVGFSPPPIYCPLLTAASACPSVLYATCM